MIHAEELRQLNRFAKEATREDFILAFAQEGMLRWDCFERACNKDVALTYSMLKPENRVKFLKMINKY